MTAQDIAARSESIKETAIRKAEADPRLKPFDLRVLRALVGVSDAYLSTTIPRADLALLCAATHGAVTGSLKRLVKLQWIDMGTRRDRYGGTRSHWIEVEFSTSRPRS